MPPVKTVSFIENEDHLALDAVTKKKKTLLPRPAFFRYQAKQQEAREASSSPREGGVTTGRTGEAISRENAEPCNELEQPNDTENGVTYSYITAPVLRRTKKTITGISISQRMGDNKIIISEITRGGLFASSDLKVGDEVVSINNIDTHGLQVKDLGTMIGEMSGCVTILARRQLSKVKKTTSDQKSVDVPETESANSSTNLVSGGTVEGVAKPRKVETDKSPPVPALRQLTKVKKIPLFRNRKVAFAPSVVGGVKTERKSPTMEQDPTYVTIAAHIVKPTKKMKTGLSIRKGTDEMIKISEITKGGLVDWSGLKVGDEVLSVNGIKTKGLSVKDVAAMLRDSTGSVTILARRRLEKEIDTPQVVTPPITNQESFDGASFITEQTSVDWDDTLSFQSTMSSLGGSSYMTSESSGTFLTPFILAALCWK